MSSVQLKYIYPNEQYTSYTEEHLSFQKTVKSGWKSFCMEVNQCISFRTEGYTD